METNDPLLNIWTASYHFEHFDIIVTFWNNLIQWLRF